MIKKVLVVDDDLDAHQLIQDMLQVSLESVKVDRAMSGENFLKKMGEAAIPYDLVLFNVRMKNENDADILATARNLYPALTDRIVLVADAPLCEEHASAEDMVCISKPFSLDHFGEVVKRVCRG